MYDILPGTPLINIASAVDWNETYEAGEKLDKQFPNQDAWDFLSAVRHNGHPFGEEPPAITDIKMTKQGANDEGSWEWKVSFANGDIWKVEGWCDYTGWDCQSGIDWTPRFYGRQRSDPKTAIAFAHASARLEGGVVSAGVAHDIDDVAFGRLSADDAVRRRLALIHR